MLGSGSPSSSFSIGAITTMADSDDDGAFPPVPPVSENKSSRRSKISSALKIPSSAVPLPAPVSASKNTPVPPLFSRSVIVTPSSWMASEPSPNEIMTLVRVRLRV